MSIKIIANGDIFAGNHAAVVIPVNAVGTPGKGLALAAAKRWPEWAKDYKRACKVYQLQAGEIHVSRFDYTPPSTPRYIIAAAVKDHWRDPSTLECVEQVLCPLRAWAWKSHPRDLAVPALGCGLGGLAWSDVLPLMEAILPQAGCEIVVYASHVAPMDGRR